MVWAKPNISAQHYRPTSDGNVLMMSGDNGIDDKYKGVIHVLLQLGENISITIESSSIDRSFIQLPF